MCHAPRPWRGTSPSPTFFWLECRAHQGVKIGCIGPNGTSARCRLCRRTPPLAGDKPQPYIFLAWSPAAPVRMKIGCIGWHGTSSSVIATTRTSPLTIPAFAANDDCEGAGNDDLVSGWRGARELRARGDALLAEWRLISCARSRYGTRCGARSAARSLRGTPWRSLSLCQLCTRGACRSRRNHQRWPSRKSCRTA